MVSPADVLAPGSPGPAVVIPYANLGLVAGDNMGDFTYAEPGGTLFFSVDRASQGAPGTAVNWQAGNNQAAGDIFTSTPNGGNSLWLNQNQLGLVPPVGPNTYVPPGTALDCINGLAVTGPSGPLYYVLAPGSPTLARIGASSDDILTSIGSAPTIAVTYTRLGLRTGDEIEGLALVGGTWLLTLAPGSPTLGLIDATSSDILKDYADGRLPFVDITYDQIGLLSTDNVLSISEVPEPTTLAVVGLSILSVLGCGLRRRMAKA
jgi:hypothetical protein